MHPADVTFTTDVTTTRLEFVLVKKNNSILLPNKVILVHVHTRLKKILLIHNLNLFFLSFVKDTVSFDESPHLKNKKNERIPGTVYR